MIDEKKLIEALRHDINCFETDGMKDNEMYIRVDDVIRMIEGQPKIDVWISAYSLETPREIGVYPVKRRSAFSDEWIQTSYFDGDSFEHDGVIAWMPFLIAET